MRKNFHRLPDPRAAVVASLSTRLIRAIRFIGIRVNIQMAGGGDVHNNGGVGIYWH